MRQTRSFVIARDDEHWYAALRNTPERFVRLIRDRRRDRRPIEHVAGVHNEIDFAGEGGRKRGGVVGEKIIAAASPSYAGAYGQVEAEVRVGQKQDSDGGRHPFYLLLVSGYGTWGSVSRISDD